METIAKYELREVLGRGGMGIVYRAYDPLMDREVALKIIQERALDVPELRARFAREARMAGKLSHDNIAVVYDLGEADGKTFIVMEYLPGDNLRTIIERRESLTLQERLDYAAQICRGLHYAHASGIIHRDIKPENIQVLPNRRIKIMDFGIAKPQLEGNLTTGTFSNLTLTSAGMRIGTPSYMSPEQVKGLPIDRRSDIFALGVLLYELFTYQKPFRGDDTTVLYKIVHEEPEPLQLDDSSLSTLLQRVVGKCLAKDPAMRYDNCLEVLRDLQEARPRTRASQSDAVTEDSETADSSMLMMLPGNLVGQVVSHFRILAKVGDGGMGTVYKAEDLSLKRIVALKFLLSEGTLNPRTKERFLMEAQAASALDHPNICTIYEIGETGGGLFFICMSFCSGEDLGKILHKRNLDVREALDICTKVARGLAVAHEHGIIHRDIKPANIIVSPTGDTRIVDFGLAKLSGGAQFTRMASVLGTLPYMSPEQIKGADVDRRTDIWSLGVVLYQALAGRLPFEGPYEAALFYTIVNETPALPTSIRPALPPRLDEIVMKALAKKPDDRYGSMEQLLKDMQGVLGETSTKEISQEFGASEVTTLIENGRMFLERRRFTEALSRFEAALRLSPGHPGAESLRIRSLQELAQAKEIESLVHEAEALLERKKEREAREVLLGVSARDPQNHHALELLNRIQNTLEREEQRAKLLVDAEFYLRRGNFTEARGCYQKVLDLDPDNREALKGLKRSERKNDAATSRALKRTPLPSPPQKRRQMLVPALVAFLIISGALAWYLLRPAAGTPALETAANSPASETPTRTETQQQGALTPTVHDNVATPGTGSAITRPDLKAQVAEIRKDLEKEKARAEGLGTSVAKSTPYREAARHEREGNRLAGGGTNQTLEKALTVYSKARDRYRDAANASLASAENNPPAIPNNRSGKPGQQSEAEVGQPSTKTNDETAGRETQKTLAVEAPPNNPTTPTSPPTREVQKAAETDPQSKQTPQGAMASNDANFEAAARMEINKLLQEYRESIEQGDLSRLGHLLNLSDQAQGNWSLFFSSSDNRKVSIEGINLDIDRDNARVTFKTKMSFFNNQTNTPQSSENARQWVLEPDNGRWKIVTQK